MKTDGQGEYVFSGLPPAACRVTDVMDGFADFEESKKNAARSEWRVSQSDSRALETRRA